MDRAKVSDSVGGPHRLNVAELQYSIHKEVQSAHKLRGGVLGKYDLVVIPYVPYFAKAALLNLGYLRGYLLQGVHGGIFAAEIFEEYKC